MNRHNGITILMVAAVLLVAGTAAAEVRSAILAGSWYPAQPDQLRRMARDFIDQAAAPPLPGRLVALAAPHAGYIYSGPTAGQAYARVMGRKFDLVVLIGPSHQAAFPGVSIDPREYETPLGRVSAAPDLIEKIIKESDGLVDSYPEIHDQEHGLEIQLPFLQVALKDFRIIPIIMGRQDLETCRRLALVLVRVLGGQNVLLVGSTDLSHYHSAEQATARDNILLERTAALDPEGLHRDLSSGRVEACGGGPLVAVMLAAKMLGADRAEILKYSHSGVATGDNSRVVGYMAAAFFQAADETAAGATSPQAGVDLGLGPLEQKILLETARSAILAALTGTGFTPTENPPPSLMEQRGAFVTLKTNGRLRGCIGRLETDQPLLATTAQMAVQAAFRDPRFPPLDQSEVKDLTLEISVLTPFEQVKSIDEITVGVHGLLISRGHDQGLLLPQVPVEQGWDREEFLKQTCLKAGLPPDAWKEGATVYRFSAQVFGEE
ncbi:MAG: AmmeMemoRadiSam system protein B [Pseudomonadota bacterium]